MKKVMLLTQENKKKLPPLYHNNERGIADPMVYVKLFALGSAATWYLCEYSEVAPDGDPRLAWGLCDLYGDGGEVGYVSLDELESLKYGSIPRIERDRYFEPCRLSVVQKAIAEGRSL